MLDATTILIGAAHSTQSSNSPSIPPDIISSIALATLQQDDIAVEDGDVDNDSVVYIDEARRRAPIIATATTYRHPEVLADYFTDITAAETVIAAPAIDNDGFSATSGNDREDERVAPVSEKASYLASAAHTSKRHHSKDIIDPVTEDSLNLYYRDTTRKEATIQHNQEGDKQLHHEEGKDDREKQEGDNETRKEEEATIIPVTNRSHRYKKKTTDEKKKKYTFHYKWRGGDAGRSQGLRSKEQVDEDTDTDPCACVMEKESGLQLETVSKNKISSMKYEVIQRACFFQYWHMMRDDSFVRISKATGRLGCFQSYDIVSQQHDNVCYVTGGDSCRGAQPSHVFEELRWRFCDPISEAVFADNGDATHPPVTTITRTADHAEYSSHERDKDAPPTTCSNCTITASKELSKCYCSKTLTARIDLRNRGIRSVLNGAFSEMEDSTSLREIDLSNNLVEVIEPGAFGRLYSLQTIRLNDNPVAEPAIGLHKHRRIPAGYPGLPLTLFDSMGTTKLNIVMPSSHIKNLSSFVHVDVVSVANRTYRALVFPRVLLVCCISCI
eukprot:jgi/Bigna1/84908/estExt_fgenesh1_pg.C_10336